MRTNSSLPTDLLNGLFFLSGNVGATVAVVTQRIVSTMSDWKRQSNEDESRLEEVRSRLEIQFRPGHSETNGADRDPR